MNEFDSIDQCLSISIDSEKVNEIEVPLYDENGNIIKYLSDWKDYKLPEGHCVVNKTVCGCGYTQYCLTNPDNLILVSPRKTLIINKSEQNKNCYYFCPIELTRKEKNNLIKDISDSDIAENIIREECYKRQYESLTKYLNNELIPIKKILVTNDSFPKLVKILSTIYFKETLLSMFRIIVDEFQLIFTDSRFKANIELDLLTYLQEFNSVTYVSATPILAKYLVQIPELSGLPYQRLNWGVRAVRPLIENIKCSNITQYALEEIKMYKDGKFCHSKKNFLGEEIVSKELVIYSSNISIITGLIKKSNLTPDQVNIICADTEDNVKKIRLLGKGFLIGKAPLKGQPHKMFTFCTSTAYCGVDFYSTCARTIILSNCNLSSMSIDISLELPQIIGRQRLIEVNPFALDAVFVYTTTIKNFTLEKLKKYINNKISNTESAIRLFGRACDENERNVLRRSVRLSVKTQNYSEDYSGVNQKTGDIVFNHLVYLSEIRAWEIQNKNYENDISVITSIVDDGMLEFYKEHETEESTLKRLSYEILAIPKFEDKIKKCSDYYSIDSRHPIFNYLPAEFKEYLDILGPSGLSKASWKESKIKEAISGVSSEVKQELLDSDSETNKDYIHNLIKDELTNYIVIGKKYSKREIKEIFKQIKEKRGLPIVPKSVLINDYYNTCPSKVTDPETNKYAIGYKILSFLDQ